MTTRDRTRMNAPAVCPGCISVPYISLYMLETPGESLYCIDSNTIAYRPIHRLMVNKYALRLLAEEFKS